MLKEIHVNRKSNTMKGIKAMKRIKEMKMLAIKAGAILLLSSMIGGVFAAGYFLGNHKPSEKADSMKHLKTSAVDSLEQTGLKVVTKTKIEAKLVEIGELSTYSEIYHVERDEEYFRVMFDRYKIPFTGNKIQLTCDGIVKVGYDITDLEANVVGHEIQVKLPEIQVLDNYIAWDSIDCTEKDNVLNPIGFERYQEMFAEIEAEGLKKAESEKIYQKAEDNFKNIITNFLAEFDSYDVVFVE